MVAFTALAAGQTVDPAHLAGLKWRGIGPFRGGRVSAVAGVVTQPDVFYIGLPQGGVWKTTSAGQTWYPVFDAVKEVSSVGSVQVAPSDPNVVYAGTGEISGNGRGIGVYRSPDAGKTWSHMGLDDTQLVPSLLVDPHDPNLVLAAALGSENAASDQRGVFRTRDGGKTWSRTLLIDKEIGIQHLAWAYDNPGVIFATSLRRFRAPGKPGGPDRGMGIDLYRSTDEGVTWKKLTPTGLPKVEGRVCVAVAQGTKSQRVFLIGTFGLYRSDDEGATWRHMAADDSRIANGQGYYTSGVYVDPQNPDIVYTLATCVYRSLDGGKTFEAFKGAPGGDDPQQMWIDPVDRTHILLGGDQGATVSLDAGQTWGSWYNQPTGQFYHISVDNQFPYWVYATQQDSGSIATVSRGNLGQITPQDWLAHPGMEAGYILVDPLDPKVSYAPGPTGGIIRVTYPSGEWVQIEPNMSPESELRGGFSQMAFSESRPRELLIAYQYLMSSTDRGAHWSKLSPDLTVDPAEKKPAASDAERFTFITSFATTPAAQGTIWAATVNGFIKLTRDHGDTWEDVSLPIRSGQKRAGVICIEASHVDPAAAYVWVGSLGEKQPRAHLFRTRDFGKTWTELANASHASDSFDDRPIVIRSDARRAGLLFTLTGKQVLVSFDDGDDWQSLNLNLPTTELTDLAIHGNDLVLSTFGRGIWILDDYSPLRQISAKTMAAPAHLFKPADAIRVRRNLNGDTPFPPEVPHAENPPLGAEIYYSLASKPAGPIQLEILDRSGKVVRHLSSAPIEPYDDPAPPVPFFWLEVRKPIPAKKGLNRVNWNFRYDTPPAFNHDGGDVMGAVPGDTPQAIEGPLALPGVYTVRLTVDGKTYSQGVVVRKDPRSPATDRDLRLLHELQMDLCAAIQEAWDGYGQAETMRAEVKAIVDSHPAEEVAKAAKEFGDKLDKTAGTVIHVRRFYGPPSPTTFVGLNGYLLARLESLDFGDMAPSDPLLEAYGSDWSKLRAVADTWRTLNAKDLAKLNALLRQHGLKPIETPGPALTEPPAPKPRYLPKPLPSPVKTPAKSG